MPRRSLGSDPKSLAGRPEEKAVLLGQVFTPPQIADQMVKAALVKGDRRKRFILDPSVGPATFPKAMACSGLLSRNDSLTLFDVDKAMAGKTLDWARECGVHADVKCEDYLEAETGRLYDVAILNPPYVRQEWIDRKRAYQDLFSKRYNIKVPGTSNLYVYFVAKVIFDLDLGGRFSCIVYDSWQSTKYGKWLWDLLSRECESLECTPVGGRPFGDRLIDATIITGQRRTSCPTHPQSVPIPSTDKSPFANLSGFETVDELFQTKRGLRLKQAKFFLCELDKVRSCGATPFVKKSSGILGYAVPGNHPEAVLLVTLAHGDRRVRSEIERRLLLAIKEPKSNVPILTWHREREDTWCVHRPAPYAPLLFNYYLRKVPRHLYNADRFYADNFYGLTPKSRIDPLVPLAILNSTIVAIDILAHARNQGNGLAKIQLFEYRQVRMPDWTKMSRTTINRLRGLGRKLVKSERRSPELIEEIDAQIAAELNLPVLRRNRLQALFRKVDDSARKPKG